MIDIIAVGMDVLEDIKKLYPLLGFQTRRGKNYTRYTIMASSYEVLVRDVC